MVELVLVLWGSLVASAPPPAVTTTAARPVLVAKGDKDKKPKKKKDASGGGKKKGGPFTSCAALATKAECDAHAKDHSCAWDAIAAGGSCGDGAPM